MIHPFSLEAHVPRIAATACVLVALCTRGTARAQDPSDSARATGEPSPADASAPSSESAPVEAPNLTRARDAFRLGTTLARQGQWREALAAYERSAEIRPHPVTSYNIGYVERALGQLTRARKHLAQALEEGERPEQEPLPENLKSLARSYLSEIDRKLVHASITLAEANATISVDGRPLEASSAGSPVLTAGTASPGRPQKPPSAAFELLVDPGHHVILLDVTGKDRTLIEQSFEPGGTVVLRLTIEHGAMPNANAHPAVRTDAAASPPNRPWMWTALGVGAAGVLTGSVFGILALEKNGELSDACIPKSNCPPSKRGDKDHLDAYALGADIGFGIGIVGLGVGTALWLTGGPKKDEPAHPSLRTPHIDVSPRGVAVSGWF